MYKFIGFLIIANAIIIVSWWLMGEHPNKGWAFTICLAVIFFGAFIVLHERITEISVKNIGTIKAAVERATADANEIAEIRKRIEAQSATVDLVAQKANTTIVQLHNIALSSAEASITELMAANFMGGTTLEARLNLHDQIINSLRDIGIEEDRILKIDNMWVKGVGIIYHRGIRYELEGRTKPDIINIEASSELRKASNDFQELINFKKWEVPSPGEMELFQ
ncbi:MAG: hypothetical protein KKE62_10170 [Proteobacteria bacterium]|nr:hypothetical protein [Pseudomonadota bacterium]MBU1387507.1 hypothetical protein [Pseudomonadota bacterium]MBU1543192.1 hypothetical protein [Pseudomonadota bacterium]MBU2483400.1 hypothetical protein [Pseudomonadota bacterium]